QIMSSVFESNKALSSYVYKAQGGAVSALTDSKLNVSHCSFKKNAATPQIISSTSPLTYSGSGGAVFVQTAQIFLTHSYFECNGVSDNVFHSAHVVVWFS